MAACYMPGKANHNDAKHLIAHNRPMGDNGSALFRGGLCGRHGDLGYVNAVYYSRLYVGDSNVGVNDHRLALLVHGNTVVEYYLGNIELGRLLTVVCNSVAVASVCTVDIELGDSLAVEGILVKLNAELEVYV